MSARHQSTVFENQTKRLILINWSIQCDEQYYCKEMITVDNLLRHE